MQAKQAIEGGMVRERIDLMELGEYLARHHLRVVRELTGWWWTKVGWALAVWTERSQQCEAAVEEAERGM